MTIGRRQYPLLLRTSLICFIQLLALLSSYSFRQAHSIDLEIWKHKFEGEDADIYSGGSVRSSNNPKHKGYTGNGYADFGGKGSFVQWEIETTFNKAEYDIIIQYNYATSLVSSRPTSARWMLGTDQRISSIHGGDTKYCRSGIEGQHTKIQESSWRN
jgi:hypothetical protein